MERRPFGSEGPRVAVVGQGTWALEGDDRATAVRALRRGLDLGMTHVDTAEMYGTGAVEELLGEALAGRRDEVFLVSKVVPENASAKGTVRACERSLKKLGTDHLDCYLLHWAGSFPLEETLGAFEQLRREGKIRSYGVSNFDEKELAEAVAIAGLGRIACNQVLYHLGERAVEHAVLPYCRAQGIALVAYSPFGSGDFPREGSAGRRLLDDIGAAHEVSAHAVALRFLLRDPQVLTIPKAADPGHVEANALAGDLRLTDEELRRIDEAFPRGRRRRGVPMI